MGCKRCYREYNERPNDLCDDLIHWKGYVQELEVKSQSNYAIHADKPESDDYYNGKLWDTYCGDMIIELGIERDKLIDVWAGCLLTNMRLHHNEKGYNIVAMRDGRPLEEDEQKEMFEEANKLAVQWHKEAQEREAQKIANQKAQEERRNNDLQRKMYESLKKKFEPQQ